MIPARLDVVPVSSLLHRLRAETKVVGVAGLSTTLAFYPDWVPLALGVAALAAAFVVGRIPLGVLAPPPRILLILLAISAFFSFDTGGDPVVGGVELGGLEGLARLVLLGFLVVLLASVLAWTTPLPDLGTALAGLLRPLRFVRVPVDELATVLALAVRAVPLVASELQVVLDARRTRPPPPRPTTGPRWRRARPLQAFGDAADVGVAVVVNAHRRAAELADAMTARAADSAPPPPPGRLRGADWAALCCSAALIAAIIVVG